MSLHPKRIPSPSSSPLPTTSLPTWILLPLLLFLLFLGAVILPEGVQCKSLSSSSSYSSISRHFSSSSSSSSSPHTLEWYRGSEDVDYGDGRGPIHREWSSHRGDDGKDKDPLAKNLFSDPFLRAFSHLIFGDEEEAQ
ncbi:MAG: hypothetical protein DHS80DRAFT_31014 [Piptocephalis tieghemiana]|nr:MAG: hypothetical protein DHS80DRAFT_31014 [Piptocephalis tieghemiana]